MDKKNLENLKKALEGKEISPEFKLVLSKQEILEALEEVLKQIGADNTKANENLIIKLNQEIEVLSKLDNNAELKIIEENIFKIGALLIELKDKTPIKEISINNLGVLLQKIDELKAKPIWYKNFSFEFDKLFAGLIDIADAFWKKIWQVEVKNETPIKIWVVDKKGNVIERFSSRQSVLGSPVDITQNVNIVSGLTDTSTPYKNLDVDESGDLVITGAKKLCAYTITNLATATRYIKFYDKATAPTVGTDTPVITFPLSAGAAANLSFDENHLWPFSLGIGIGATTGVADNNTGAPGANEIVVNLWYK